MFCASHLSAFACATKFAFSFPCAFAFPFFSWQWTPAGDAFVIGSDLKRLETETLPQYFRHNRFQSLVRQLNFYSFRKINRERNVWIYKHELFHRDHPGDLHMVRRRTCPGLDGRKQRFSRYSARKLTDNSGSENDDSSVDVSPPIPAAEEPVSPETGTKRNVDMGASTEEHPEKRQRVWKPESVYDMLGQESAVDTSLLVLASQEKLKYHAEKEKTVEPPKVNERAEMAERSHIVSELAKKLEKFAKKAYGPNVGKGRRNSSGVVTPPFGASSSLATTNLLTYDDEYNEGKESGNVIGVVTDGEESSSSGDDDSGSQETSFSPRIGKNLFSAPAGDVKTALKISERVQDLQVENAAARAVVTKFCITHTPHGDSDIGSKIFELISSCENLASWFNSYRTALDPFAPSEKDTVVRSYHELASQSFDAEISLQQHWAQEAGRLKAIHDFSVFAVNCIHGILGKEGSSMTTTSSCLTMEDERVLERAVLFWSKNV